MSLFCISVPKDLMRRTPSLPAVDLKLMLAQFGSIRKQSIETAVVLYADAAGRLVGIRKRRGKVTAVDLPIRTIARDALLLGAEAVVMAHNHPSGDPEPSPADLSFTRRLVRGLDALGIELKDHLVLTGDRATSLRERGVV